VTAACVGGRTLATGAEAARAPCVGGRTLATVAEAPRAACVGGRTRATVAEAPRAPSVDASLVGCACGMPAVVDDLLEAEGVEIVFAAEMHPLAASALPSCSCGIWGDVPPVAFGKPAVPMSLVLVLPVRKEVQML
jgi:hypothetical protein